MGTCGSHLSDILFCNFEDKPEQRNIDLKKGYAQYKSRDLEFYYQLRKNNWLDSTCNFAIKLEKLFGKGNFFIELQNELDLNDRLPLMIQPIIVESLREVAKQTNIPAIASGDPHYATKDQSIDQRMMLSLNLRETEESVKEKLEDPSNQDVFVFFGSDTFYIKGREQLEQQGFSDQELDLTNKIAKQIDKYEILSNPIIPKINIHLDTHKYDTFYKDCKTDSDKNVMFLAIEGAKKSKLWEYNTKHSKEDYWQRLLYETKIIFEAGLSDYLLLTWDLLSFCDFCPSDGSFDWLTNLRNHGKISPIARGCGRGSVGGCLTARFLNIHKVDPLKYNLLFSRFFNSSRKNDLADIDNDIEASKRDIVVNYLEHKYGKECVSQLITFGRIQGKNAIRDVMRVKGIDNHVEISTQICEYIPDESKIADDIQEMKDAGEEYGILEWSLLHSEELQKYAQQSEYKPVFDQAKRIEGTKKNAGRHASGFIITDKPIQQLFPLALDTKSKKQIVSFDMKNITKVGGVKIDLLGLTLLDRLKKCENLVNGTTT